MIYQMEKDANHALIEKINPIMARYVKENNVSLVLEKKVSDKQYLNISTLSKGVYQIKFEGTDWVETRKLIKN